MKWNAVLSFTKATQSNILRISFSMTGAIRTIPAEG